MWEQLLQKMSCWNCYLLNKFPSPYIILMQFISLYDKYYKKKKKQTDSCGITVAIADTSSGNVVKWFG